MDIGSLFLVNTLWKLLQNSLKSLRRGNFPEFRWHIFKLTLDLNNSQENVLTASTAALASRHFPCFKVGVPFWRCPLSAVPLSFCTGQYCWKLGSLRLTDVYLIRGRLPAGTPTCDTGSGLFVWHNSNKARTCVDVLDAHNDKRPCLSERMSARVCVCLCV